MRKREFLGRTCGIAAVICASAALAEDELGERKPVSAVLFGSLEAGPAKLFSSVGQKQAYGSGGLNASGWRTMASLGISREQPRTRFGLRIDKVEGQSLFGYEWRVRDTFVSAYAGPDFEIRQRSCGCLTQTTLFRGGRLHADIWATPTRETMLQASAYVSSIGRGRFWLRAAPGYALPAPVAAYIGPELELFRADRYDKLRLGLHLSGLRLFGLTWRLAGGWQKTSDQRGEAYATLGLFWRRGQEE